MNFKKSFLAIAMSAMMSVGSMGAKVNGAGTENSILDTAKEVVTDYAFPIASLLPLIKGGVGFGLSFTDYETPGEIKDNMEEKYSKLSYYLDEYFPGIKGSSMIDIGAEGSSKFVYKQGKLANLINILMSIPGLYVGGMKIADLIKGE